MEGRAGLGTGVCQICGGGGCIREFRTEASAGEPPTGVTSKQMARVGLGTPVGEEGRGGPGSSPWCDAARRQGVEGERRW